MEESIFLMGSVTNAMRGKAVLEKNGYRAFVQRHTALNDQNGCGYRLLVWGDVQKALLILQKAGLKVRGQKRGEQP